MVSYIFIKNMTLFNSKNSRKWLLACMLGLLPWLVACSEKTVASSVVGYNHTDRGVMFSLNGAGTYLSAHTGGGNFTCCVSLPPWRPGLTEKVEWSWSGSDEWFEETVSIPEYDYRRTGQVSVHFLRNGEVKVFVVFGGMRDPDYPLKGPEAGLWPPGGGPPPPPTGTDAIMATLRRFNIEGVSKVPDEVLRAFIVCHTQDGRNKGIIQDSRDELKYAILAYSTTGDFWKHPLVQRDLSQPDFSSDRPFHQWTNNLPEDIWDTGSPLGKVLEAHPNDVMIADDCSVVGQE